MNSTKGAQGLQKNASKCKMPVGIQAI